MRIKRTKTGSGGPSGLPASTVTHYAAEVDSTGCVVAWTADESQAAEFDARAIEKVKQQYAGRLLAGALTFLGEEPAEEFACPVMTPELQAAVDEVAQLRRENESLAAELASLRSKTNGAEEEAPVTARRWNNRPRKVAPQEEITPPQPSSVEGE